MSAPALPPGARYHADLDPALPCETHGHVFGLIRGSVRHCIRYDCHARDGYDPDDLTTLDGAPIYDEDGHLIPPAPLWATDGTDFYQIRTPRK